MNTVLRWTNISWLLCLLSFAGIGMMKSGHNKELKALSAKLESQAKPTVAPRDGGDDGTFESQNLRKKVEKLEEENKRLNRLLDSHTSRERTNRLSASEAAGENSTLQERLVEERSKNEDLKKENSRLEKELEIAQFAEPSSTSHPESEKLLEFKRDMKKLLECKMLLGAGSDDFFAQMPPADFLEALPELLILCATTAVKCIKEVKEEDINVFEKSANQVVDVFRSHIEGLEEMRKEFDAFKERHSRLDHELEIARAELTSAQELLQGVDDWKALERIFKQFNTDCLRYNKMEREMEVIRKFARSCGNEEKPELEQRLEAIKDEFTKMNEADHCEEYNKWLNELQFLVSAKHREELQRTKQKLKEVQAELKQVQAALEKSQVELTKVSKTLKKPPQPECDGKSCKTGKALEAEKTAHEVTRKKLEGEKTNQARVIVKLHARVAALEAPLFKPELLWKWKLEKVILTMQMDRPIDMPVKEMPRVATVEVLKDGCEIKFPYPYTVTFPKEDKKNVRNLGLLYCTESRVVTEVWHQGYRKEWPIKSGSAASDKAYSEGIRSGDKIIKINGTCTKSMAKRKFDATFCNALKAKREFSITLGDRDSDARTPLKSTRRAKFVKDMEKSKTAELSGLF